MSNPVVVLTDQVFPDVATERAILAEAGATLTVATGSRADVLALAATADAILTTYFPLGAADIRLLARCTIIARYGIGVDNIDLAAADDMGIAVTNVPDYCIEEVAAHTVALLLAVLRRLPEGHQEAVGGRWGVGALRPMQRPSQLSVGLVGFGRIARRVARALRAMDMGVLVHDPYLGADAGGVETVALDELLARSDAVSLHCPLTPQTRGLIGADALRLMKPGSVLVNTARGPLVHTESVLSALRDGRLRAAALDVLDREPPEPGLIADVPGLLVTPHVAYYSEASLRESQRKAATQVVKRLTGRPLDYPVAAGGEVRQADR
jgi:D-3-phosphoglycerate dehydrogenase / 2-oxoglutarate reductase